MLNLITASLCFSPTAWNLGQEGNAAAAPSRRALLSQLPVAALAAIAASSISAPAFPDGANTKEAAFKARSIYGSRIFALKGASSADIAEEKNAFTLFISGVYRGTKDKPIAKQLEKIARQTLRAAAAGNDAKAQAGVNEFLAVGNIDRMYTDVKGGHYDPVLPRNPGAPPAAEIEAMRATKAFAGYKAYGVVKPEP